MDIAKAVIQVHSVDGDGRRVKAKAHKRDAPISHWMQQLLARMGWQKACVALANKNARILWALMTRGEDYDARHEPVKPVAKVKPKPEQAGPMPAPA